MWSLRAKAIRWVGLISSGSVQSVSSVHHYLLFVICIPASCSFVFLTVCADITEYTPVLLSIHHTRCVVIRICGHGSLSLVSTAFRLWLHEGPFEKKKTKHLPDLTFVLHFTPNAGYEPAFGRGLRGYCTMYSVHAVDIICCNVWQTGMAASLSVRAWN